MRKDKDKQSSSIQNLILIDIGKDFAKHLGGRYKKDSEYSGEEFLEKLLEPAFLKHEKVVIQLDSLEGYSAGFLEESFGGLVRKYGYEAVIKKLELRSEKRKYLIKRIQEFMWDARGI